MKLDKEIVNSKDSFTINLPNNNFNNYISIPMDDIFKKDEFLLIKSMVVPEDLTQS